MQIKKSRLFIITICLMCSLYCFQGSSYLKNEAMSLNTVLSYHGYVINNIKPFKEFCISKGYDFGEEKSKQNLKQNFYDLYEEALNDNVINYYEK